MKYYILFETAEDGYYGDFPIGNKLYNEDEVKTYIQTHAQKVYEEEKEIKYWFEAESTNKYGTGLFYFREFTTNEKYNNPTEEEILKEFEKLNYKVIIFDDTVLVLNNRVLGVTFYIRKLYKNYEKYNENSFVYEAITFQEHQLLTKLFKVWR